MAGVDRGCDDGADLAPDATGQVRPHRRQSSGSSVLGVALRVVRHATRRGHVTTPEPAHRAPHVLGRFDVQLDPTLAREATVRTNARVGERAALIVGREPDPEIALLLADRKTREERVADEVAPAPEHRRDPDTGPAGDRLIQSLRRPGAPTLEGAAGLSSLAPAPETSYPSRRVRAFFPWQPRRP